MWEVLIAPLSGVAVGGRALDGVGLVRGKAEGSTASVVVAGRRVELGGDAGSAVAREG